MVASGLSHIGQIAALRRLISLALCALMLVLPMMVGSANAATLVIPAGQAPLDQAVSGSTDQDHCTPEPSQQEKDCVVHCLDWGMPAPVKLSRPHKFDKAIPPLAMGMEPAAQTYLAILPPLAGELGRPLVRDLWPSASHPIYASTCRYRL